MSPFQTHVVDNQPPDQYSPIADRWLGTCDELDQIVAQARQLGWTVGITVDDVLLQTIVTLINLGARLQVLESETDLSYERLLRLYKEVSGKSPSKGQLPFSTDWFMTWQPNIHATLLASPNIRTVISWRYE